MAEDPYRQHELHHHHYTSSYSSLASTSTQPRAYPAATYPPSRASHIPSQRSTSSQSLTSSSQALPTLRKPASLARITVPSFSAFRSQTSSIPVLAASPATAKRKPHPLLAAHSPRSASVSFAERNTPRLAETTPRPFSLDSPFTPFAEDEEDESKPLPRLPPPGSHARTQSIESRLDGYPQSLVSGSAYNLSRRSSIPIHEKYSNEHTISHAPMHSVSGSEASSGYSPHVKNDRLSPDRHKDLPAPPDLKLQLDSVQRTMSNDSLSSPRAQDPRPKSPGGKLGAFFGWKSSPLPAATDSPTTTFSERSNPSPGPSPRLTPPGIDVQRANGLAYGAPETPFLIGEPVNLQHVKELEKELEHVSTELAGSIKREMELEDELDRIRAEIPNLPPSDRRGSDYFSDSGASSTRYPISNVDERVEELEAKLRKCEQERAQAKVQLASRIQVELARRKELEERVQQLEDNHDLTIAENESKLQMNLEDTRRRLSTTRQEKDNLEELYTATKLELSQYRNERDNLRDEIVPALKARVEGLEAHAADSQAQMYEHSRMEFSTGRGEMPHIPRFESILEEGENPASLSRSSSLAKRGALNRSGSVKDQGGRQRAGSLSVPLTAEGLRELENQRDALHKALRLLITRHDKQQKEHKRAVQKLTVARAKAEVASPSRTGYHKEVSLLKEEVTTLRKRTEDALEQKWEYEKGLGGLKMDLDRAEQETRALRALLQEKSFGPSSPTRNGKSASPDRGETELDISELEQQRDSTRQKASEYRQKAASLSNKKSSENLVQAASRLEELAAQLDKEVEANKQLRQKLSAAVTKGEKQQKDSTRQIEEMQRRLASMEDSVLAAQQHSEATLGNHEAEARRLEEATSPSLQRLRISIPEPNRLSPTSPSMGLKSPRTAGKKLAETSLQEASRTSMLERKVKDLEGLLREAEEEMQMVVQRVNRSQIEVADLQTERDAALVQMRKLQKLIVEESKRAEAASR